MFSFLNLNSTKVFEILKLEGQAGAWWRAAVPAMLKIAQGRHRGLPHQGF
jgi:hypothetical protein